MKKDDPTQIKPRLSEFGNRVLEDIYLSKGCPTNISICYQPLDCDGALRVSRYGSPTARNYDGVHMRGKLAVQHYTGSIVNVLLDDMPNINQPAGSYAHVAKSNPQFPQTCSNSGHTSPRPIFAQPKAVHPAGAKNAQNVRPGFFNANTRNMFNFSVSGN